jgi:hypothetical protein
MSAAIMAISKLAAVKTSPIAQATPLFRPIPERSNSPIKRFDKAHLDHRSPDIFLHNNYRLLGRFD